LYQMLAGVPPFDGDSAQSILMKQATVTPVPIQHHRSEIPPTLAGVVDRALAKDRRALPDGRGAEPGAGRRPPHGGPGQRAGALVPGDAALYVFSPRGADDTTLLLVARRNVAVVTPHRVRGYRRDSVQVRYGAELRGGLAFRMVLTLPRARRDTVFRHLSFRD